MQHLQDGDECAEQMTRMVTAALGAAVSVTRAVDALLRPAETWQAYRKATEGMKREYRLYLKRRCLRPSTGRRNRLPAPGRACRDLHRRGTAAILAVPRQEHAAARNTKDPTRKGAGLDLILAPRLRRPRSGRCASSKCRVG